MTGGSCRFLRTPRPASVKRATAQRSGLMLTADASIGEADDAAGDTIMDGRPSADRQLVDPMAAAPEAVIGQRGLAGSATELS